MGRLYSQTQDRPRVVNGAALGEPALLHLDGTPPGPGDNVIDLWWVWDDATIPDGYLLDDGTIADTAPPTTIDALIQAVAQAEGITL